MQGIPRDHTTPYINRKICHECGEAFKKRETLKSGKVVEIKLFDDPWATEACIVRVHVDNDEEGHGTCLDKLTDQSWADFRYFDCPICQRLIVGQCLDNGWRSYRKEHRGEEICVKCYQEIKLEEGENVEMFEKGKIPGDFYNASDLNAFGWSLVPGMGDKHIDTTSSSHAFCQMALTMTRKGYKVLVDYDNMAIGGLEGYVSLYCKRPKPEPIVVGLQPADLFLNA
uniref:Uncharacterized protein n=1 Tax=viral metagenome TaxID=1070528 RepID=A0A6H1ZXA6_9ZZZZ